jgi:hypothetical protein
MKRITFSPGRFFAAAVLKMMLAHMLINYEMKLKSLDKPVKHTIQSKYTIGHGNLDFYKGHR